MAHIVIVGGGIAGLSAAYDLERAGGHEVTLIEAADRLGGKIATERVGDYLLELGPDSIFAVKPWAVQLIEELGMGDQLVDPIATDFAILVGGKLHQVPRALASLMPSASNTLEKVSFFSAATKRRILKEKEVEKGPGGAESIAAFFRRRFGRKFSELVAEPLLAGIHAGDPEKLSMSALYPSYLGLEQKHGSLTGGPGAHPPKGGPNRASFVALRDGMGSLVIRLQDSLKTTQLLTGTRVARIEGRDGRLVVFTDDDRELVVDHLVLAVPAEIAAPLLTQVAPGAAAALGKIRYVSTAVVTLAFPRGAFPKDLCGNGFLVPFMEPSDITGSTWSSNKWPGRAPGDTLLMRCFMGRDGGLAVDQCTDEQLIGRALGTIEKVLHPIQKPIYSRADRWPKAMAQYELGHLDLLAEAEKGLSRLAIYLVGSSYRGNSVSDCVRQGRDAARSILHVP